MNNNTIRVLLGRVLTTTILLLTFILFLFRSLLFVVLSVAPLILLNFGTKYAHEAGGVLPSPRIDTASRTVTDRWGRPNHPRDGPWSAPATSPQSDRTQRHSTPHHTRYHCSTCMHSRSHHWRANATVLRGTRIPWRRIPSRHSYRP